MPGNQSRRGRAAHHGERLRLFVALDVPEAVCSSLGELAQRLAKTCPSARWMRLAGAHITLKFIGEVPATRVEQIRAALGRVPLSHIEMRFAGLGFFPNARRPRVLWAGVEAGAALGALANAIETALVPLGVPAENRDFKPHLTLARFNSPEGLDGLRSAIAELPSTDFGWATPEHFYLYQSVLKRAGAEYT